MLCIVAGSAFCAGIAVGFLAAVWIAHSWVRYEKRDEMRKRHERLLEECSWFEVADCIHRK
jgi:hypothetical protein